MRLKCFKFLAIILIMISAVLPGFTQEKIEVELGEKKMSEGNQTAFTVFVPEATETALVQKAWKGFVSQESIIKYISKATTIGLVEISTKSKKEKKALVKNLGKLETRGGELVTTNFLFDEISSKKVDLIALIEKADDGVYVHSFFKYGENQFVEKSTLKKDAENALSSFMQAFGVKAYGVVVAGQIDVEEKLLKEQEKILSDLEKDNKSLHKSIEKSEKELSEINTELGTLNAESKQIAEGLAGIAESLNGMTKTSFDYDIAKKNEKEKLKEKKKNDKQIDACKSNTKKNEKTISDAKTKIEENLEAQSTQKQVIADQKELVKQFETKLSNIK